MDSFLYGANKPDESDNKMMQTAITPHNNLKQFGLKSEDRFVVSEDSPILYSYSPIYDNSISDTQKPCLEFYSCNKLAQISIDAYKHMHDLKRKELKLRYVLLQ